MPEPIKRYQEFVDKIYDPNAKLDWRPESWLGERVESVTGPKYTEEDVRIFRSHVPEYRKIEKEARKNGTWLQMPDGTTWTGDPREWVLMQSKAFKKNYQDNPWYTGQAEWATKVTLSDGTMVDTDKVKRARYHNGEMWFSDDAGYAQYFADAVGEGGIGRRNENYETSDVRGKVFLSAIPKKGNYRYLYNNSKGDLWWDMPYDLTDNDIVRSKKIGKSKNDKWIIKSEGLNLKTDDIVNHSKKLGDDGIFMFNVMDGPVRRNIGDLPYYAVPNTGINEEMDPEGPSNSMHLEIPVNEFISQPGFTEKIKFIRGNNGNFDPNTDDKYSAIFKIDSPLFAKKGGRIRIKKKNRGKFTEYCGGKVTEECIAKGKKSKDPKIRKRATFAANARKWKHATGGPLGRPNFKESKEAYYDPETDTVFAPDSLGEFYHHEMFHARPNLQLLESLKPYYHNLNDDVLKQMGADLSFVKRFNNDPGHFYSPEELGARVVSASEMLNRMGVNNVTLDFLKNARLNENAYGNNFRDLLHMYNDDHLVKIFNTVRKHENGGILKAQEGTGNLLTPHPLSPVGIALNQARAMAKSKENQPHLPPGVKEVVGPDGKKVAIRTEQPLQPLEQSIAEWLPGTGDVAEVGYIANDLKNGNYGSAALAAAMIALPGNVGKLWRRIDLPGLHLQSTMPGSVFEKTLSKDGFINKKTVEQYLSKPDVSVGEKSILGKIQFPENGKMDYNEFRKAVQNELSSVQYSQNWRSFEIFDKDFTGYENPYSAYGLDRLGYKLETDPGSGTKYDFSPDAIYNRSITYSNPRLIGGDARHFDYNTLGHTRAFISKAEPDVYHVLESQSDFFQRGDPAKRMWFDPDTGVSNIIRSESGDFIPTSNLKYGLSGDSWTTNEWNRLLENRTINQGDVPSQELSYIYKWWSERQLSESVLNASSNGATKLRYPTRDTAAKIEKYEPINVGGKLSYKPEHETILKKYTDFPRISKRAGFGNPIISTDIHGNTWYEIVVPKDFHVNGEYRAFKNGGDL